MEATELRIGNIVDYNGTYRGRGITEISYDFMRYLLDVSDEWGFVEPIPLTEEWLLKFGLEDLWFQVATNSDGDAFCMAEINKDRIKYVHQLQNLYFALTGEELKIEL